MIHNFRNLHCFDSDFSSRKNLIFGKNGAGKTSILEALYLLGIGKSFREKNKKNVVQFNSDHFSIDSIVSSDNGIVKISNFYNNKSIFLINEKKEHLSKIQSFYVPLFFSSDICQLLVNDYFYKRRFFDRLIFGFDSLYLTQLLRYNHCIRQKNRLLKFNINHKELESWNYILSEYIFSIIKQRLLFINTLNVYLSDMVGNNLNIFYKPSIFQENFSREFVFEYLCSKANTEIKFQSCIFGPHRDKFELYNNKNHPLIFNSNGEKKVLIVYLFICYFNYFYAIRNEYPVLLIDDFDAAMDNDNISNVFLRNHKMQIIATSVKNYSFFDKSIFLDKEM